MGAKATTPNQNDSAYVSPSNFIRRLVSQNRRRMLVGGYDLDMSYITPRILAMSFPAQQLKAIYRNPMWQVKDVLEMRHHGHYKVYNLCIEEKYDPFNFLGFVERYPFDDHRVPPLSMIKEFCDSVHSWLSSDLKNVVVIHCMAGKGRTGLMVCSYLVYVGMLPEDALRLFAEKRTTDNLGQVTIPSQRRYVDYWHKSLLFTKGCLPAVNLPRTSSRVLKRIRVYDAIHTKKIYFAFSEMRKFHGQLYRPSVHKFNGRCSRKIINSDIEQEKCLECYFDNTAQVIGDVRVEFKDSFDGDHFLHACFNTAFIENNLLQFSISELDKVGSSAKSRAKWVAGPMFRVELHFVPVKPNIKNRTRSTPPLEYRL